MTSDQIESVLDPLDKVRSLLHEAHAAALKLTAGIDMVSPIVAAVDAIGVLLDATVSTRNLWLIMFHDAVKAEADAAIKDIEDNS